MKIFLSKLKETEVNFVKNKIFKNPVDYESLFELIQGRDELPIEYILFLKNINLKNYENERENEEGILHVDTEKKTNHLSVIKIEIEEILNKIDVLKLKTSILRLYITGRSRNRESYDQVSSWLKSGKLNFQSRGSFFSLSILNSKLKKFNKGLENLLKLKVKIVEKEQEAKNAKKEINLDGYESKRIEFVDEIAEELSGICFLLENIETLVASNNEE